MNRTRILFDIVLILILCILLSIFLKDYNYFKEKFVTLINIFEAKQVNIPSSKYNSRSYNFQTVNTTNNFEPKNIEDLKNIYYTVLNNGWENFSFYCPEEYKNCYDDVLTLADNNEYISLINNYVSTYNQYKKYNTSANTAGEIRLNIEKLYSDEEIMVLKLKISQILKTFNIDKNNIKLQDLMKIQDYILKNITYDEEYTLVDTDSPSSNAYGALNTGKAVCSGYTDLFALFLDELNIPNFKVTTDNHIWNVVYFGNKWRHVDVTWDDDEINENNNYNFFMIDTETLLNKDINEHNFNINLYLELLNQK